MFIIIIIALMLSYEVYKLISPEWEIVQRNTMGAIREEKETCGTVDYQSYLTADLGKYTILQLLYMVGELIMFLSFEPKYMVAVIAIKVLSKVINAKGKRKMDARLIRLDSIATIGILMLSMCV